MFTGIIEAVGRIAAVSPAGAGVRVRIDAGGLPLAEVALGDSIAVNGCCLTVVTRDATHFEADASRETLACTTLGALAPGGRVNLERALTLASRLGGHLVSGHVDGVGTVRTRTPEGGSERFRVAAPADLARYVARKGSICIDGVSLTVNAVAGAEFEVQIIPHTATHTIIDDYRPGQRVNIEVDLVARYVERLAGADGEGAVDRSLLARTGFLPG